MVVFAEDADVSKIAFVSMGGAALFTVALAAQPIVPDVLLIHSKVCILKSSYTLNRLHFPESIDSLYPRWRLS